MVWPCVAAVLLLAGGGESKEERRNREAVPKLAQELPPFVKKLEAVVAALPDASTLQPTSCPADLIPPKKVSHDSTYHRVHVIHEPTLRQLIALQATPRQGKFNPDSLLTTIEWRRLLEDPAKRAYSVHYGYQKVTIHNLMGVLLAGEYSLGEVRGKTIVKPAWYRGWFTLFDWQQAKLLAAFPVHGATGREVMVMTRRGRRVNWAEKLRDAASDNVMIGVERGMRQYCPMVAVQTHFF